MLEKFSEARAWRRLPEAEPRGRRRRTETAWGNKPTTYKQGVCLLQEEKGPIQLWVPGAQWFLQPGAPGGSVSVLGHGFPEATCDPWLQPWGSGDEA